MKVIIMRGLPGSGKSTWLRASYPDAVVCSADHYHIGNDGVYRFDPTLAGRAHVECLRKFHNAVTDPEVQKAVGILAVDNTNLTAWEIAPYYRLAELFALEVEIVRLETNPWRCTVRNVHQVPEGTVFRMYQTLLNEVLPPWWKEQVVIASGGLL